MHASILAVFEGEVSQHSGINTKYQYVTPLFMIVVE